MKTSIKNFYRGTTKSFTVEVFVNGENPDISSDDVIFTLKRKKSDGDFEAVITSAGDVIASGTGGLAIFDITKEDTDIDPRKYYWDIQWQRAIGKEDILATGSLMVLDRVSDV